MSDERIDVEVTDKVASSVEKKLRGIGEAAGSAHNYVERLKAELASMNVAGLVKLEAASNSTTRALAQEMNAQARLVAATAKSTVADAAAAVQKQKLATETARTEAAMARAATASANSATAQLRAAQAAQRAADATRLTASAQDTLQSELEQTRAAYDRGEINIRKYIAAMQAQNAASRVGGGGAGVNVTEEARRTRGAIDSVNEGARQLRGTNANIIAQLQDIGVSLAGGQNPFLVLIQQGSQLSYIASTMDGGFKALTATILRMLAPFALLAAAGGALYLGFKSFTDDMATRHKPELEKYANSLGLTSKEMNKLEGATVSANGKLKEHDVITITMADSWAGFWDTVMEGLSTFQGAWDTTTNYVKTVWDAVMGFLYYAFAGFYASVVGGFRAIYKILTNLPSVAKNTAIGIANAAVAAVEWAINKAIDGIKLLTDPVSDLLASVGINVGKFSHVTFGRMAQDGKDAADIIGEEFQGALGDFQRTTTAFGQLWEKNTVGRARKRIKSLRDAIVDNRTAPKPKKDSDPKTQLDYINDTNKALDNELSRMRMLKDEREEQSRLDQIEQEFLRRRMPLDAAQLKVFADKIHAIQQYKYVQSEMDRITEEATGPLRTLNAVQAAATDLLARHIITQQQYNEEIAKSSRAYKQATDPLFSMTEQVEAATRAAGLYGVQVERNNFLEGIRQTYADKGKSIYDESTGALKSEVAALVAKNDALLQQQYIQGQIGEIVNPMLENQMMIDNKAAMYAEIQRLRDLDVLNEQQAAQARYALDAKFNEMRLSNVSATFGALAKLSASGNAELAAIGKASAVAQATIDGYVAVQKALASGPPPWNFIQAAAVGVATGVQVAGILSTNVGSYATGGQFMVEGKSGIDTNNINMNVSRGERVTVETRAQQRAADGGGGNGDVSVPVKIINAYDPDEIIAAMDGDDGDNVIFNSLSRNPNRLQALIKGNG